MAGVRTKDGHTMSLRQFLVVMISTAMLAGGCSSQPGSPHESASPTPGDLPDTYEVRRQFRDGPSPQQVADRAAAYARTMATGSTPAAQPVASQTALSGGSPAASGVQFDSPTYTEPTAEPVVLTGSRFAPTVGIAVPPAPRLRGDPHATLLRSAVGANALSDLPQEVPLSADFDTQPKHGATSATTNDPLGKQLSRRARENPRDVISQFDYQLYALIGGGSSPDRSPDMGGAQLASTVQLSSDDGDVMATVVDGVANYRATVRTNPNLSPTQQIRPLQAMVNQLRTQADLAVTTVAVCRRVDGFGRYDPILPAYIPIGRQVIVYCEVDNFEPRPMPSNQWETRLTQQVSLDGPDGSVAWSDTPRAVTDVCRSKRSDFFAYERLVLPPSVSAGQYTLRVTVTDRNANKVGESSMPVSVGG